MARNEEICFLKNVEIGLDGAPDAVFREIKRLFCELGIFGEGLSLEYKGILYRVCCDEECFMVYRANESSGCFHHVPGWPVCLVTSHSVFEECRTQSLGDDHHACDLDLVRWLQVVATHFGQPDIDSPP